MVRPKGFEPLTYGSGGRGDHRCKLFFVSYLDIPWRRPVTYMVT